jgi:hypothetical protein
LCRCEQDERHIRLRSDGREWRIFLEKLLTAAAAVNPERDILVCLTQNVDKDVWPERGVIESGEIGGACRGLASPDDETLLSVSIICYTYM